MEIRKGEESELNNCQLVYIQGVYMSNGEIVVNGNCFRISKVEDFIYIEKDEK